MLPLAALPAAVAVRRQQAQRLEQLLRQHGIPTVEVAPRSQPVYLRYPVLVNDKPGALAQARRLRIPLGDWFHSPLHPIARGWSAWGYAAGSCPVAESVARRVVNIALGPQVLESALAQAVDLVRAYP